MELEMEMEMEMEAQSGGTWMISSGGSCHRRLFQIDHID